MRSFTQFFRLLLASCACLIVTAGWSKTEVYVQTAGTLSSLISTSEKELKVTGVINGSDIKFIRQLINSGKVSILDWSEVGIVAGGEAYFESYTTTDNTIGEKMFQECSGLQQIALPTTLWKIQGDAFKQTGLTSIDIPSSVREILNSAFCYCNSLSTVVVGENVMTIDGGLFWGSNVKEVFMKPISVPNPPKPAYLFSSSPKIYVYSEALSDYKKAGWSEYGTLYGTLENYYPRDAEDDSVSELCQDFFEDAACTQLKAEYQQMGDEELTSAFTQAGMPEYMVSIALKIKNEAWAAYEKEFRIHSYKPYSDAIDWNDKLWIGAACYAGNPTGILCQSYSDKLYVFVDSDVPSDATLYIVGCGFDQEIYQKGGRKLKKGLNVVEGESDKLYYILYTADTKSVTKRLDEWPDMKIHIEGGKVEGYYDASRHTDADYKALLAGAIHSNFVLKGKHTIMNAWTSILKNKCPNKIAKAVECTDSVSVWEKYLFGITEAVANGEKAGAPYYLTGGDAFYPGYFNNPTYFDCNGGTAVAFARAFGVHFSQGPAENVLCCIPGEYNENAISHEFGHQLQAPINLEGTTEGSNDLFTLLCHFLMGWQATTGRPLSFTMQKFAEHEPFYWRGPDYSTLRMYYSLYLYYHQAQKNTSFYPELFKELRKDKIQTYGANTNNSGLKFVKKVCKIAQEDLTDFFTAYGFFEPVSNRYLDCYGDHYVTATKAGINSAKKNIAQYPEKNRVILFIEDRVENIPTTDFMTTAGGQRSYRNWEKVGQCGDVGQFTSYLPGACEPANYTYLRADTLVACEGTGGVGFLMLDANGDFAYASNCKNFCIPSSIGRIGVDFTLYAIDADGTMHEVTRANGGEEKVNLPSGGRLKAILATTPSSDQVIKLAISGKIHGKDIKYLRQLINENNLVSIDLTQAQVITNTTFEYYTKDSKKYYTSANTIGDYAFYDLNKLTSIQLPLSITKIGESAFDRSGLKLIVIPNKVTSVGVCAFSSCDLLTTVVIGKSVHEMGRGCFWGSGVKDVYAQPLTPPNVSDYLFGSKPTIHVYANALEAYQNSRWAEYGTIVGDLTDDIIDGIQEIYEEPDTWSDLEENTPVYDLMGRRVADMKPGRIYIRNGKKILFSKH